MADFNIDGSYVFFNMETGMALLSTIRPVGALQWKPNKGKLDLVNLKEKLIEFSNKWDIPLCIYLGKDKGYQELNTGG